MIKIDEYIRISNIEYSTLGCLLIMLQNGEKFYFQNIFKSHIIKGTGRLPTI